MPNLLSGSTLRDGGSGEFITLAGAMPQLPATETTLTGFTIVTNELLQTTYRSSLGFVEFTTSSMYGALPDGQINVLATGTTYNAISTSTASFVVQGGVGIGANLIVEDDIVVNGITVGRGYEGFNNVVIRGTATNVLNDYPEGQNSIAIGHTTLDGLATSNKAIAIGRLALSSGTLVQNTIAIGDSALKQLGVADSELISTITNVVLPAQLTLAGLSNATTATADIPFHNLSTGTKIYFQGVLGYNLTTTTNAVNNKSFYVNPVNTLTVELYYNKSLTSALNGTSATVYVTGGTVDQPIRVTSPGHGLSTGTEVTLNNIVGTTELNGQHVFIEVISSSTFDAFTDNILKTPVIGTSYTAYSSSGTVSRTYIRNRNIAIGTGAAESFIDGESNFFFGDRVAQNFTTGSNNFIIGHQVATNLVRGSGIIAIGADNIVDGVDNQINIGSVFYYNGTGTATINADTEVGLGTESTSSTTGALTVVGGAGVEKSLHVGNELHVNSSTFVYGDLLPGTTTTNLGSPSNPFKSLYLNGTTLYLSTVTLKSPDDLTFKVESTAGYVTQTVGNLYLNSGLVSNGVGSGSLRVTGGAGILGDVNLGAALTVEGGGAVSLSPDGASVTIKPTTGGSVEIRPATEGTIDNMAIGQNDAADANFNVTQVLATTSATNSTTGALTVLGGVGIQGKVYAATGLPEENYELFTPRTYITSGTPPSQARIGEFWIDDLTAALFLRIKEGTSTFWVQIGST